MVIPMTIHRGELQRRAIPVSTQDRMKEVGGLPHVFAFGRNIGCWPLCEALRGRACPHSRASIDGRRTILGHWVPACLVESECGAVAVGRTYLFPPLSSG